MLQMFKNICTAQKDVKKTVKIPLSCHPKITFIPLCECVHTLMHIYSHKHVFIFICTKMRSYFFLLQQSIMTIFPC